MKRMWFAVFVSTLLAGCTLNAPLDPANLAQPLDDLLGNIQDAIDDAVADPLDQRPFPVLVGGSSARLYYATNLGDLKINFPGPTGTVVVPGYFGPSNLYQRDARQRELLAPLLPSGTFTGLGTDGRYVAFAAIRDLSSPAASAVVVLDTGGLSARTIFEPVDEGMGLDGVQIEVDAARVAFLVREPGAGTNAVRIQALEGERAARDVAGSDLILSFALRGSRLVWIEADGALQRVMLLDLATDERRVLDADALNASFFEPQVFLTANRAVWSEAAADDGLSRVLAYNFTTGETSVWSDALQGTLSGASDSFALAEELVADLPDRPNQIVIRRYGADGSVKKLADFRADGLAGQSAVLGDRAVWVNPQRRIVVAPLAGGDRQSFEPF